MFLLFICLFPVSLAAQDRVTLSGEVRGEDGAPLPMVTVAIENTTAGTYTDDRGRYSLSLKPGKHTLIITLFGYNTIKTTLDIRRNKTLDFVMEENSVTLNTVEVYGKSKTQKVKEGALTVNALDIKPQISSLKNLNEMVNRTVGIKIREEGGVGSDFDLSINGLSGNSVRYFIDGMPLDANQLTITEEQMLYDLGIPIGGGLSHMLGNMYLDPLDQFCKRVLGIKRYIRYMDDIIILDNDKERLKEYGRRMTQFLEERLHLNFNSKTALRPVRVGCEFVGFVIYNDHVILRKSTTLRMKRTLRKTRQDYHDNLITFKEANATMQSYLAMLSHVDCKKFKEKLLNEFVLTHADDNGEEQIINVIETGGIGALDYETMYC